MKSEHKIAAHNHRLQIGQDHPLRLSSAVHRRAQIKLHYNAPSTDMDIVDLILLRAQIMHESIVNQQLKIVLFRGRGSNVAEITRHDK